MLSCLEDVYPGGAREDGFLPSLVAWLLALAPRAIMGIPQYRNGDMAATCTW